MVMTTDFYDALTGGGLTVSTGDRPPRARGDHGDGELKSHQLPGERERIAFHIHQFNHGCFGDHCSESNHLYVAWQATLRKSR